MKEKVIHFGKEFIPYVIIVIVILLIKQFLVTTVLVSGSSMNDTLYHHDMLLLNRIVYQFHEIERFDIVVVQMENEKIIKRVIGLPGETIAYRDNTLYVNGKKVKDPYGKGYTADFSLDMLELEKIPEGYYFVMGDNRNNSLDSRRIGVINEKDILGKSQFVLFPLTRFGKVK